MTCTCPSGDGSLRWPCPEHLPPRKTDGPDPRKRVEATRLVSEPILSTNQQRARDLWRRIVHAPDVVRPPDVIAAALDAAEQRGRAEAAAKIEALADKWTGPANPYRHAANGSYDAGARNAYLHHADELRALAADVAGQPAGEPT